MRKPAIRLLGLLTVCTLVAASSACEQRAFPTQAGIGRPPVNFTGLNGSFILVRVDGVDMPHTTSFAGTTYSLVSGTFAMNTDSTWLYSSNEVLSGANGQTIGTSPANYTGTWTTSDSTINILTGYGVMRVRGDTLIWRGGPRHHWEDTLTFTLVRR